MNAFIKLENGDLLNLSQIIKAFRSNGGYWIKTAGETSPISESDFRKLQNLSI